MNPTLESEKKQPSILQSIIGPQVIMSSLFALLIEITADQARRMVRAKFASITSSHSIDFHAYNKVASTTGYTVTMSNGTNNPTQTGTGSVPFELTDEITYDVQQTDKDGIIFNINN
jgi:hypothetical protein